MCYIDLLHKSAGSFCVFVKALRNEFSTELTYKKRYPVPDTDLEISGGGGGVIQTLRQEGGTVSKNFFSTLRVSVWFKNRGEGPGPPGPSRGSATDILVT